MRSVAETPPAEYWQELRELEFQIREREQPVTRVVYPGAIAVDAWASGELELDTTGYMAVRDEPVFKRHRVMVALTAFNLSDVGREDPGSLNLQRVYELDLTPKHESAIVFPVYNLKLTRYGIARRSWEEERVLDKQRNAAQKLGGKRADFTKISEHDREFIREQLVRGSTGVYSRAKI